MSDVRLALLRGINVGRAKRLAMADLRSLVEGLGYRDVQTVLNSGNVVFTVPKTVRGDPASKIEEAVVAKVGFASRVVVLTAKEVATTVRENPLVTVAQDATRLQVMVLMTPADRMQLRPLLKERWSPEAFALGPRVAYLWCPQGVIRSRLMGAVSRILGDDGTARNMATLTKIHALMLG